MKKFKKVITFGMLLSALSLIIAQAVTATILLVMVPLHLMLVQII